MQDKLETLNEFQSACAAAVSELLASHGVSSPRFVARSTDEMSFLHAALQYRGKNFELFIYADEAEIDYGEDYVVCERFDFETPHDLIAAYRATVERLLFACRKQGDA